MAPHQTPGQFVESLLKERGWTARLLAVILRIDESSVNKVINDKRPIDAQLAIALEDIFEGVEAKEFLALQQEHDLAQARRVSKPDPQRQRRACVFGHLPVSAMIKRGWVPARDIRDVFRVEEGLKQFFGVGSVDEIVVPNHAAKRTNADADPAPVQLAWLQRVRQIAQSVTPAGPYSAAALQVVVARLRSLRASIGGVGQVARLLSEAGVRFVVVEGLAGGKIDGVCTWLADGPVIGMSLRFDRVDNYWFVLRHEVEHVLRGDGKGDLVVVDSLEGERAGSGDALPEAERIANAAAAEFCSPQRELAALLQRKGTFLSDADLTGFAAEHQIHPGVVAGQVQRRTGRYGLFRRHQVRVRDLIIDSASLVDGWGRVALP